MDEVADRGAVGRGAHLNEEAALGEDAERDPCFEPAGIAHLAVERGKREEEGAAPRLATPDPPVEAARAAMKVVTALVEGEAVLISVEDQNPAAYAAAPAAQGGAKERVARPVLGEAVVAEHHVGEPTACIGNDAGLERRASLGD
jgi:hypothetical protein